MNDAGSSLGAFCALALILGARHGLDADHIAVIDGVTRLNARHRPRLSRYAGSLFSLGHGTLILAVVACASLLATGWQLPGWLEFSGTAVSIAFLLTLAILNLSAAIRTPAGVVVPVAGIRARWLMQSPLLRTPRGVFVTGLLFAISFDSISQALLFAVVGSDLGAFGALSAGACFVAGMLVVDGINSLWISRLITAAQHRAAIASRIMAALVGLASLAVGGLILLETALPAVGEWGDTHGLAIGVTVCAALTFAGLLALALTGKRPATEEQMEIDG